MPGDGRKYLNMDMEIIISDRGLLSEVAAWLSYFPCPDAESTGRLRAAILTHLEATKGDSPSWKTQARQLIAETGEETTRLLATKFVADEAVKLVGELVGALDEIVDVASEIHPPGDPRTAGIWVATIGSAREVLAKAAQFTNAIAETAPTVGGETEPQIFPPVDAVPEYVPDWGGVSFRFKWVAVDPNGFVFAYEIAPMIGVESWVVSTKAKVNETDFYLSSKIPPPPGDTWKQMIYKRPE